MARTEDPDYKAPGIGAVDDLERASQTDEEEKAKSRDVTVNEMPVLR